ncbi:cytochrome c biogenesis protein [Mangrovibacterium marinum]|uniref:ABC-type transport system involved in cytochrome c biogenesis permease subunit n=1 Tax=Mangrovibacterium marinum TaxID=1639118 RepID=A0A2T5BR17_9BACT|nr:cytochrome c biogenesis protein CcsA [Mangrovibacterium marinum]PTN01595.1 ABC-type transport system involved in cytochrome c biogenesis permease subunit [Mangrovibacterium marinum]
MWYNFEIFAIISLVTWILAIGASLSDKTGKIANLTAILGTLSLAVFIILLWANLQRPPLRTLGETRLWYSFFLAISGYVIFKRWKIKLMLIYSLGMAILFLLLNYLNPDIHSKTLMPALQSIWFVPHVIVYMIAYALLGLSALFGLQGLYAIRKGNLKEDFVLKTDNIVYIGFGFLTLGLIFGALWAKEAWGHYWTWDPKETWAFLTWAVYLIYIHFRIKSNLSHKSVFLILMLAFVVLLICWFGINYLPAAQNSVHVYSS